MLVTLSVVVMVLAAAAAQLVVPMSAEEVVVSTQSDVTVSKEKTNTIVSFLENWFVHSIVFALSPCLACA